MFKRKEKIVRTEIDMQVNLINAEVLRIVKNGTYIVQFNQLLPNSQMREVCEKLKSTTGAKFIVMSGNAQIWRAD